MPSVVLANPTSEEPINLRRRAFQRLQSFVQKLLKMTGKGATKGAATNGSNRSVETTRVVAAVGKQSKPALAAPTVSSAAKNVSNNNNKATAPAKASEEKLKLGGGAAKGSVGKASAKVTTVKKEKEKEAPPPMAKKQPVPKNPTLSRAQTGEKLKLGGGSQKPKASDQKASGEQQQGAKGSPRKRHQRRKPTNHHPAPPPSSLQSKEAVEKGKTYYLKCDESLYTGLVGGGGGNDWKLGESCMLCERDLAYAPVPPETESGAVNFPEAAVLGCGHVFHLLCLTMASDEHAGEPVCFFCESLG